MHLGPSAEERESRGFASLTAGHSLAAVCRVLSPGLESLLQLSQVDVKLDRRGPVIILGARVPCGALRCKPHPQTDAFELRLLSG